MVIHDIALTLVPAVGSRGAAHLIEIFGSAEKIFEASADELILRAELKPDIAREFVRKTYLSEAEKELRFCEKNGVVPISAVDTRYPRLLLECGDHPHVIFYKGDPAALTKDALAMVGTRRITAYGQKMSERLVGEIALRKPDIVVVSGLAMGVDGACHRAALAVGLPTIGVLADPMPRIGPAMNVQMGEEMARRGGGLIWENRSEGIGGRTLFASRNRIIAGMTAGTVVVESPEKGGSMMTARLAGDYDRVVMALPGRVGDAMSEGTNLLIRTQQARMVCSAEDVFNELDWLSASDKKTRTRKLPEAGTDAARIYELLPEGDSIDIEQLGALTGLSSGELAMALMELEFDNLIRMLPGKRYEVN